MVIINGLKHFFVKFIQAMENGFFGIVAICAYLIGYPAQIGILIFALALFITDILTKFNALRVQNQGLYKAFTNKKITSRSFWDGFITKAIGYFVILTIANLLTTTPQINVIGKILATIMYCGLAFYEVISNLENLRDANFLGAIPILNKLKKEQDKFMESESLSDIKDQIIDAVKEQIGTNNQDIISKDGEVGNG